MLKNSIVYALLFGLIVAIICEISLRYFFGIGHPVLFTESQEYGIFPRENQDLYRFGKHIVINKKGMRSSAFEESKPTGETRIEFVGDSVPFGTTYIDQSEIFPVKIETALNRSEEKRYKILNASSPGWAPENEYRYLKATGIWSSDLVIAVYNTKDLAQPFSIVHNSPIAPTENPPFALAELWSRYAKPRLGLSPAVVDNGSTNDDGRPNQDATTAFLKTVSATNDFVRGQGAKFAILFIPAMTKDVLNNQADWDSARHRLEKWASMNDVGFLDLTLALGSIDPAQIYFDGIHLRPFGNDTVTASFVAWIKKPLVKQPSFPQVISSRTN